MKPILWAELPFHDLQARRDDGVDAVLLPIGGTLPHGPHLPCGCDSLLCETVCHAVSACTAVPVLPTISLGVSSAFGSLNVAPATLMAVVNDTLEAALKFGVRRVIIFSGSAENLPAIESALQTLRTRHGELLAVAKPLWDATPQTRAAWHSDAKSEALPPHAGLAETALVQYLAPHLAGAAQLPPNVPSRETIFQMGQDDYAGTPAEATAQLGEELFEALVAGWTRFVKRALIEGHASETSAVTMLTANSGGELFRAPGSEP
jgi:creatinine amidohydrolase